MGLLRYSLTLLEMVLIFVVFVVKLPLGDPLSRPLVIAALLAIVTAAVSPWLVLPAPAWALLLGEGEGRLDHEGQEHGESRRVSNQW